MFVVKSDTGLFKKSSYATAKLFIWTNKIDSNQQIIEALFLWK